MRVYKKSIDNTLRGGDMNNLKVKLLSANQRNMVAMAIKPNTKTTKIFLHGIAKDGSPQWYESKGVFTKSTALNYFYAGEYSVVFAQGMTKSKVQNWI